MIQIIDNPISQKDLNKFLGQPYSDMVKFVVDTRKEIMALGGELHSDAEAVLIENGSRQSELWGANIYPAKPKNERLEYTSLINIRPSIKNNSILIQSDATKAKVKSIVDKLIP